MIAPTRSLGVVKLSGTSLRKSLIRASTNKPFNCQSLSNDPHFNSVSSSCLSKFGERLAIFSHWTDWEEYSGKREEFLVGMRLLSRLFAVISTEGRSLNDS